VPNSNIFRAGGALGARRRWRPGSSEEELLADLEAARDEDLVDQVAARAPDMTPAQADRLRRLVNSPELAG
jgi:hypothetical protein